MYTNHIHNNVIDGNWVTNSGFIRPGCNPIGHNDYRLDNPKQKEWLATWGLLATLIWLYVEALRLLQKFAIKFR